MSSEFLGARASNAGDDFHELWAARHAISLLANDDGLGAITVEGVGAEDEATADARAWDGVDCALYYGGVDCPSASRIVIEQLKYSAASPEAPWTLARSTYAKRAGQSVIGKLAKAWFAANSLAKNGVPVNAVLVSNQPVDTDLTSCVSRIVAAGGATTWASGTDEHRFAAASGLKEPELSQFCASLRFDSGAGSRFAAEEKLLAAVARWAESDIKFGVMRLREFIRNRMRPETAGQVITRDSVLLHFGDLTGETLFPAPATLSKIENPVRRASVGLVSEALARGDQFVALQGQGGIGKTTALQQIERELPADSLMVVYDCYGGGTYLDPSALRHRPRDFYVQLINEIATRLQLPLILTRAPEDDLPRLFRSRLVRAAESLHARSPGALLVIAVDAADNALIAAETRGRNEQTFVLDFVKIEGIPLNVRFIVSARTGRIDRLELPRSYKRMAIEPFGREETKQFVQRKVSADDAWIDDFHVLSNGIPRVQTYALGGSTGDHNEALNRLRPYGKHLTDVFQSQMDVARRKSGEAVTQRLCSRLLAMARPIPIDALAEVLASSSAEVVDFCSDLSPGLRLDRETLNFADEDFEDFLRGEADSAMPEAHSAVARWMLASSAKSQYAAMHVAPSLAAAGRNEELLELVEREPAPEVIADTVVRREAEIQRLQLAIRVCRAANDTPRALRFVLRGADGLKTETALRDVLGSSPDLSAAFAPDTAGRLLLAVPEEMEKHGGFLFHRLAVDAQLKDTYAVREGRRRLRAWLDARSVAYESSTRPYVHRWTIKAAEVASAIEATLMVDGADAAIAELRTWNPWSVALQVALYLPSKLIAQGRSDLVASAMQSREIGPVGRLLCGVPMALAGERVLDHVLVEGLVALSRRRFHVRKFLQGSQSQESEHARLLGLALTAFELLSARGVSCPAGERLVEQITQRAFRRIDRLHAFEADKISLLLRAFTLDEARKGREADFKDFFEPRPATSSDPAARRRVSRDPDAEHDQGLAELVGSIFDTYAARGSAFANRAPQADVDLALGKAVRAFNGRDFRFSRHHESLALRTHAAANVLELIGAGYSPKPLKKYADEIHWPWIDQGAPPTDDYVRTMALRQELHSDLAKDLIRASAAARSMRTSATDKCTNLTALARLLNLISPADANGVFNHAVEGAAHIDSEAFAQIQLLERMIEAGHGRFGAPARVADDVGQVVADACVRLRDYDGFPWHPAMSALSNLDGPRALADAARWGDQGVARLDNTLPAILKAGVTQGWLPPRYAGALACLTENDHGVMDHAIEVALERDPDRVHPLVELAARDSLAVHQYESDHALRKLIERAGSDGHYAKKLKAQIDFLGSLPGRQREPAPAEATQTTPLAEPHRWTAEETSNADALWNTLSEFKLGSLPARRHSALRELLGDARNSVALKHRVDFLQAVRGLLSRHTGRSVAHALVDALVEWQGSPAIQEWCRRNLPDVVISNLVVLATRFEPEEDFLSKALALTGAPATRQAENLLDGLGAQVDKLDASLIFELVRVATGLLEKSEAADLATWYADRLAARIPAKDRLPQVDAAQYPANLDVAVARLLFASMGDFDLRQRWRAAHAARRLAGLECTEALRALVPMYATKSVPAYRSDDVLFYWLAARLWFVLAWGSIANESPSVGALAGEALLQIALDESCPHLLIRHSARQGFLALMAAGWIPPVPGAEDRLRHVNATPFEPVKRAEQTWPGRHRPAEAGVLKFDFNEMDTIPYWFEPIVRDFASIDMADFTREAARWIVDVWGYTEDVRQKERQARLDRLKRYDWQLSSNGHGSIPTVERLSNHLEWHAMWCAGGELLKTEPLAAHDYAGGGKDALELRAARTLLTEEPVWAPDLLVPIPLVEANWIAGSSPLAEWVQEVTEAHHRAELFPADRSDYVVVAGRAERWTGSRIETTAVSSALCNSRTSDALVRALQTMENAYDYGLPDEGDGDDAYIDEGDFQLTGWLVEGSNDGGLDRKDSTRKAALQVQTRPGRTVRSKHHLVRGGANRSTWHDTRSPEAPPMFVYETWGREVQDDDRYGSSLVVSGHRLLAHRAQLKRFLEGSRADLIVEVEVDRRGRTERTYSDDEPNPGRRFDRLYSLRHDAGLSVAEGRLGTWVDDRPGAAA